ncbi:hypothetical protein [Paenibacillus sp. PL91]|uniref:hypothetical protein n=1 Tax=Paenibacillus sp. PL91 TaxID=2729538 RepID=UPI00145D6379|nr:hypothetical protein [Paenibacillus sp. PL91]MBC9205079.1 hypothetical protein [Paenibacillus sp. PL91]
MKNYAIYEIVVNSSNSFEFKDIVSTLSNSKVTKVYKGNNTPGVKILETGGILEDIEYQFDDSPVLKAGDKAIVFLKKYEGPIIEAQGGFVVSGVFQGKFDIDKTTGLIKPNEHKKGKLSSVKSVSELIVK